MIFIPGPHPQLLYSWPFRWHVWWWDKYWWIHVLPNPKVPNLQHPFVQSLSVRQSLNRKPWNVKIIL